MKGPEMPDKDYDLAGIVQAGRALERAEAELTAWRRRMKRHWMGWGIVALAVAGAVWELVRW